MACMLADAEIKSIAHVAVKCTSIPCEMYDPQLSLTCFPRDDSCLTVARKGSVSKEPSTHHQACLANSDLSHFISNCTLQGYTVRQKDAHQFEVQIQKQKANFGRLSKEAT